MSNMKKLLIILGLAGIVHTSAVAQNNPVTTPIDPVIRNRDNTENNKPANVDPNYDHTHTYYETPYTDPHVHYQRIDDNPAPVNNVNNNNTMTPATNTVSPYDVTSPYYTPPNADAPLNNISPTH